MTTTTSDYTVECKVSKEVFEAFKKEDAKMGVQCSYVETQSVKSIIKEGEIDNRSSLRNTLAINNSKEFLESRAYRFKKWFINELEGILTDRPAIVDDKLPKIKIVDVTFAFKSNMLIRDLIKRGNNLMNSNNKKLNEIESKIEKKLKEKGDYFSEPVRAYIIF